MSHSHCCGGILAHSSLQHCFSSVRFLCDRLYTVLLRTCHDISIKLRSVLGQVQHHESSFQPFCCRFSGSVSNNIYKNMLDRVMHSLMFDSKIQRSSWLTHWLERSPNYHPSAIVLGSWYEILLGFQQMRGCVLWPGISTFLSYVQTTLDANL